MCVETVFEFDYRKIAHAIRIQKGEKNYQWNDVETWSFSFAELNLPFHSTQSIVVELSISTAYRNRFYQISFYQSIESIQSV